MSTMAETASNGSKNAVIVHQWLEGIGLNYAWHQFEAAGIVTPDALAELESQHFAALSVTASEDRRKLFFLVQRVKLALEQQQQQKVQSSNAIAKSKENYKPQEVTLDSPVEQDEFFDSATGSEEFESTTDEEEEDDKDSANMAYPTEPEIGVEVASGRRTRQSVRLQQQQSTTAEPRLSERQNPLPTKTHSARNSSTRTTKRANHEKYNNSSSCSSLEVRKSTRNAESTTTSGKQKAPANCTTTSYTVQMNDLPSITTTSAPTPSSPSSGRAASTAKSSPYTRNMKTKITPGTTVDCNNRNICRSASDILDDALQSDNEATSYSQINDNNNDSSKQAKPRRSSGLVAPLQRETKHARTNPSMRTGKQLSAIPADTVPPMSPLIELQLSETADGSAHQRNNKKTMRRRSGSLDGAIKRQLASTTTSRSADHSFTDYDGTDDLSVSSTQSRRRRTSLTHSGSDRSLTSSRQSLARTSSDRSLSSTGSSSSYNRNRRRASIASSKPASSTARRSLDPRTPSAESSSHTRSSGMSQSNTMRGLGWKDKIELLRAENAADFRVFHGIAQPSANHYEIDNDDNNNEMRIRVVVRKRPMSPAEIAAAGDIDIIHPLDFQQFGRILVYQPKQRVDLTKSIETIPFAFDNTFDCHATNADIYERSVRNLIPSLFEGQWASIFAYGQTGSGKTFTMMGNNFTGMNSKDSTRNNDVTNLGLYYMAALDLFHAIKTPGFEHFSIAVSLFEIYGGKLFDLLNGRALVKCLEDAKGKVCFPGLSEHQVEHPDDLISMIELGSSHRSTGTTSRNADSSRSHAVLQLHLCQKDSRRRGGTEFSRLTFIDLAGSERGADTSTASRATRLEGAEINTSLLALKEVIRALATGDSLSHVPFRGSKLTQVLKESFVGKNGRSVMIACISPNIVNCEQTLNTLRYADRVKERNPETGEMGIKAAASMKVTSAKARTPPRLKLSSNVSLTQPADDNSLSNHSFSNNSAVLDELLAPSPFRHGEDFMVNGAAVPSQSFAVVENEDAQDHVQCMEELIATHKDAMAVCLDQIKEEMMLVNQADSNREEMMVEYMRKMYTIQDEQLAMITLLREQLLQFRLAPAMSQVSDGDSDSFEDLRED